MRRNVLVERFERYREEPAVIWRGAEYSYGWLLERSAEYAARLGRAGVERTTAALEGDYSPYAIAALTALLGQAAVVVPLDAKLIDAKKEESLRTAEAEFLVTADEAGLTVKPAGFGPVRHPLLVSLTESGSPGVVIFTSGTTGRSKAAVHDADRLLGKYARPGRALRTIPFMMFDHIGGLNTMLQTLAAGGCLCIVEDRSPAEVCRTIEKHRVQALPVSPTFMNLLLLSGADREYDLLSLEAVSYGSEVMPASTLAAWNERFPNVRTVQAYGMSELGILRTKSKASNSLLMALGGDETAIRIVDGLLEIKTETAMLGYLNAANPFTADGWLQTGDMAEAEGEFIRILGRRSDLINVGGEKVYPAEVESVLQMIDNIAEAAVSGEPNGITGQLVKAVVRLNREESLPELRGRIWAFCRDKLPAYKIPRKIVITTEPLAGDRLKKMRRPVVNYPL